MKKHEHIKDPELRKYLDRWHTDEHYALTADIIPVRPSYAREADRHGKELTYQQNDIFSFEIRMIRRGQWPEEGKWALPGGFIKLGETVEEGAVRELKEETGLETDKIIPVGVFSRPGRDIRGNIVSNAFVTVLGIDDEGSQPQNTDAKEARWLRIVNPIVGDDSMELPFFDGEKSVFTINANYSIGDIKNVSVSNVRVVSGKDDQLAFDHAEIIATAVVRLRETIDPEELTLWFLPDKFTLPKYIAIYQYLTRYSQYDEKKERAVIPNLRRMLTKGKKAILEVAGGKEPKPPQGRPNPGHKQAHLYRRKK